MFVECVLRVQSKKAEFCAFLVFVAFFPITLSSFDFRLCHSRDYHYLINEKKTLLYEGKNSENKSVNQ